MTEGEFSSFTIAQLTRIEQSVVRIETALFTGNGTPSVLVRLAVLEERTPPASRKFVAGTGGIIAALIVIANFLSTVKQLP